MEASSVLSAWRRWPSVSRAPVRAKEPAQNREGTKNTATGQRNRVVSIDILADRGERATGDKKLSIRSMYPQHLIRMKPGASRWESLRSESILFHTALVYH
jgi:hypothetical protein